MIISGAFVSCGKCVLSGFQMKEGREGKTDRNMKSSSVDSNPLVLDIDDFKVKPVSLYACVHAFKSFTSNLLM